MASLLLLLRMILNTKIVVSVLNNFFTMSNRFELAPGNGMTQIFPSNGEITNFYNLNLTSLIRLGTVESRAKMRCYFSAVGCFKNIFLIR